MLPPTAISNFLNRERHDFRVYKKYPEEKLDAMAAELPVRPPIWNVLRKHQKVCLLLGIKTGRFAFWCDTGTGKTILSIALIRYLKKAGQLRHALVLVPNRINKREWEREIKKHSPKTSRCVLVGPSPQKRQLVEERKATIFVETYPGLVRMVSNMVPVGRGKRKLRPDPQLIKPLLRKFQAIVLDESTAAKNHRSLPYRVCRALSKSESTSVFTLSGTPFGRNPEDLWAQMHLVDRGKTLGETLGLFRGAFFREKVNYWGGMEYSFITKMKPLLNEFLANSSIRYTAQDSDLPALVAIKKVITLPHDTREYYEKAKATIAEAQGKVQATRNAFLRMRQISSGFLGYLNDEDGTRAEIEFTPNPKLELLLSIIETIREECKIIVFHEYRFSGSMIARELDRLKIGCVRIMGGATDKALTDARDRFDADPKCRVLLLANSMPFGLNLQVAQYGIYYESPVSPIMRKQTQARFERQGSKHEKVFMYDLVVRNTVDERILEYLREGRDLFKSIIEGKATL